MDASLGSDGTVQLRAASDSKLTEGIAGVLVSALAGLNPQQILDLDAHAFLSQLGLGPAVLAPSRAAGAANMVESIRRRTRLLMQQLPRFPSLLISRDSLQPQGAFAEAQAQYLQPDQQQVEQLVSLLTSKRIGVVAHFYMDPQVCSGPAAGQLAGSMGRACTHSAQRHLHSGRGSGSSMGVHASCTYDVCCFMCR